MRKFRKWLIGKYLPGQMKETVLRENEKLKSENMALRAELKAQVSYSEGLEYGIRAVRKITINTGDDAK